VLDNTHGNVFLGVANSSACTMHSLAWDYPEDEKEASKAFAKSEPGQVIDLPTPPDHIIVDIKPKQNIQWPQHLNLSPDSNVIHIPIGLTMQCDMKAKVGLDQSVTYYTHAVDLAFAITVWKCQDGTFKYIIALLEHTPGCPALDLFITGHMKDIANENFRFNNCITNHFCFTLFLLSFTNLAM
jgi:hypothetical protein